MEIVRAVVPMGRHAAPNRIQIQRSHPKFLEMLHLVGNSLEVSIEEIKAMAVLVLQGLIVPIHNDRLMPIKDISTGLRSN